MKIKQYDVSLVRLREENIEEVRHWRNTDKIRERMSYREYISAEMQKEWFRKIDDIHQYLYFLIEVNGKHIGLTHAKDFVQDKSEAGIFIWDDEYLNSHIPVVASVIFSDWNFYFLGNTNASCRMLKTNKHAIAYNANFGFRLCEDEENNENQLYTSRLADYEVNAPATRSKLKKLCKGMDDSIIVEFEKEDESNGVAAFFFNYHVINEVKNSPVRFKIVRP